MYLQYHYLCIWFILRADVNSQCRLKSRTVELKEKLSHGKIFISIYIDFEFYCIYTQIDCLVIFATKFPNIARTPRLAGWSERLVYRTSGISLLFGYRISIESQVCFI